MRRPSAASLKRVTPENLIGLGAERLAGILLDLAATRPELKRRLRMELAAEQGGEHLAAEIDKRLTSLQGAKGRLSWRTRPTFVRDLDVLRGLIAERLAGLDRAGALQRMWSFMALHRRTAARMRDRDGSLEAVFERAAGDLGRLIGPDAGLAFVEACADDPSAWADWTPFVLPTAPAGFAASALPLALAARTARPGWATIVRRLADAAGDIDAFRSTFSPDTLRDPQIAAEIARRLLAAGRIDEAGRALEAARAPDPSGWMIGRTKAPALDFAWEGAWIEYLDRSGQAEAAQDARWASFERTLSAERARDFTRRLTGFDDVEAEARAFAYAARHADFEKALGFLMEWPAPADAARMIAARADEAGIDPDLAELWAGKLRARQPAAALTLLRKSAAAAFRRRELAAAERLTQEADSIGAEED
jgi:hypothetical protein